MTWIWYDGGMRVNVLLEHKGNINLCKEEQSVCICEGRCVISVQSQHLHAIKPYKPDPSVI